MSMDFQNLFLNFRFLFDFVRISLPSLRKGQPHDRYH